MRHAVIEEDLERICRADLPWWAFRGKTVLISGAGGFLPAYLVETLLYLNETIPGQNTKVIGLVRNLEKAGRRLEAYRGREDLLLIGHDVTRPLPEVGRPDFIIHGASPASPRDFARDPLATVAANVWGTQYLLSLARDGRSEGFLFLSSGAVYGRPRSPQERLGEQDYGVLDPLDVNLCYAESKRLGETLCACWRHQFGVPAKIVRIGHAYGPGMRLDDGRVSRDFVADVIERRPLVLKSDGAARRSFCYLADVTTAFFTVLLHGAAGEAYNVADESSECSILELANLFVDLFPERQLRIVRETPIAVETDLRCKFSEAQTDTTKLRSLGWRPAVSLSEGLRRTVRSFEP
jgi:nucleoside-diphosphate-sugar epimerase